MDFFSTKILSIIFVYIIWFVCLHLKDILYIEAKRNATSIFKFHTRYHTKISHFDAFKKKIVWKYSIILIDSISIIEFSRKYLFNFFQWLCVPQTLELFRCRYVSKKFHLETAINIYYVGNFIYLRPAYGNSKK